MKKIIIVLLGLFIGLSGLIQAEKIADLTDIMLPKMLEIGNDIVYCMQDTTVYAYNLKDMSFIKKFVKKGQGPGELQPQPGISSFMIPFKDSILVAGMNKTLIYSKLGELKKEFKMTDLVGFLHPIGEDQYLVLKMLPDQTTGKANLILSLAGVDLKPKKELFKQGFSGGQNMIDLTADGVNVIVADDKIYIEESAEGFVVSIFDFKGNLINKIKKEQEPVRFTAEHEKRALDQLKENPAIKAVGWEQMKNVLKIKNGKYIPFIQDIQVDSGLIYLMTCNFQEDKQEFLVLDEKGKILKKIYLPSPMPRDFISVLFGRPTRFFKIYKGKYYYLKENIEEESWELHVETI